MKATGPKHERESILNWNEEDDFATLWTASQSVYNKMLKRGFKPAEDGPRHATFTLPRTKVRLPTKARPMSQAKRAALDAARAVRSTPLKQE